MSRGADYSKPIVVRSARGKAAIKAIRHDMAMKAVETRRKNKAAKFAAKVARLTNP